MAVFYITPEEYADGGEIAHARKADAVKAARDAAEGGHNSYVRRITTGDMPLRELLVAVFNHEGFAAKDVEVATFEAKEPKD